MKISLTVPTYNHKLVSRTPAENAAIGDIQLAAYAMGYRHIYGCLPKGVSLNYLVRNKVPRIVCRNVVVKDFDLIRIGKIANGVIKAIDAGIFYANPVNIMCNPKACGYWDVCH